MAQVQIDQLGWITVYLWNCGIAACDHQQKEFRLLNYCCIGDLRKSLIVKLENLPEERVQELRDFAIGWAAIQNDKLLKMMLDQFDVEQNLQSGEGRSVGTWRKALPNAA